MLVQPLILFVTVTVYVPDELTLGFGVVLPETIPGPAQLKPTGNMLVPAFVAAESTTDVVVQVSVPPVALAPGGVVLLVTDAVAVLEQLVAEFVTVTVYVPLEVTTGFAVVPPEATPGPDQLKPTPA